jgi:hypothetical protein
LKRTVEAAGFRTVDESHLGFFMYPGFWLVKQRNKRFLSHEDAAQQQVVDRNIRETGSSRVLKEVIRMELILGKWISYPIGIRCVLTCIK